ncbi:MAG: aminoacyl-tRNA hydrolase [bacterium]|nr:aminoacyl-tRNA hydrolase [bacterium]
MYYVVGLGNPGGEYELSRHNAGRIVLADFIKKQKIAEPEFNKKLKALVSEGKITKEKFQIIFPETFMNKSGLSVKPVITSKKKAANLIVVHDDVDLPLGKFKISVGKGSAGHKGVESIIKNIKTKDFIRIRVGISFATPKGKLKKPNGEKMLDFIIGNFKPKELPVLKKISKKITSALEEIISDGVNKAMSNYNK